MLKWVTQCIDRNRKCNGDHIDSLQWNTANRIDVTIYAFVVRRLGRQNVSTFPFEIIESMEEYHTSYRVYCGELEELKNEEKKRLRTEKLRHLKTILLFIRCKHEYGFLHQLRYMSNLGIGVATIN